MVLHPRLMIPGGKSYVIGVSLLGIVVGILAGLSQTPIVSSVLPLLFGLIGGASGLFLTNAAIDAPVAQARLSLIGKSLAGFCIGILVALTYGIFVRTGDLPFPRRDLSNDVPIPTEAMSKPEIAIRAIGLRTTLVNLGATHDEIDHIMRNTFVTHHDFSTDSLDYLIKDIRTVSIIGGTARRLYPSTQFSRPPLMPSIQTFPAPGPAK